MRQVLLLVAAGCTVGPKLVSVPMLESSPVVPRMTAEEDEGTTPQEEVASIAGAWTGTACCHRGAQSWPLQVTFDALHGRDVVAHAYYPDQRCRADWRLHATDSRHWQGEESVTVDPQ